MENRVVEGKELPWIKKHKDALMAREVVKVFRETPIEDPEEIVRYVGERYRRIKPPKHPDRLRRRILFEYKRLELVYNIVSSKLNTLLKLPTTNRMDEFHRVLVRMFVDDKYDEALRRVRKAVKLAKEFWTQYRLLILSAKTVDEAKRFRREGSGRILSLVRRLKKHITLLRKVREEIIKTHVVSEGLPTVVVAGIPSAGKSTLVRRLSTAEPEVADYPFTTKTVIVGKARCNDMYFYIVDTPGLLEKPFEELNEIERKALAALLTLPDLILFMFDVSKSSYVGLEGQLKLYESIAKLASEKNIPIITVANKIDAVDESMLKALEERFKDVVKISALEGTGVRELVETLCRILKQTAKYIYQV